MVSYYIRFYFFSIEVLHYSKNVKDKNKKISLSGWINKKRDHGNLLFLDLRDNYGITQCVVENSHPKFKEIEKLALETEEKAFQIINEATEKSKRDVQSFEKSSKEKLSKKLADAEKGITNAKNESLKVVNEIATDIAISLSQKVSGIKANKSTLMKKINERVSRSGSFKSLKEGN